MGRAVGVYREGRPPAGTVRMSWGVHVDGRGKGNLGRPVSRNRVQKKGIGSVRTYHAGRYDVVRDCEQGIDGAGVKEPLNR